MALTISEHTVDPDDPDGPLRRLRTPAAADGGLVDESPWVEPDYTTVAKDHELEGPGPFRNWPGPPIIMPAGLLPDGKPWGRDEMRNSFRIEGVWPRNEVEADACVQAYNRQQRFLRKEAGIERPYRDRTGLHDAPEAHTAIVEIHRREKERRRRMAG